MEFNNQESSTFERTLQVVGYRGIGIRRRAHNQTLDVNYNILWPVYLNSALEDLSNQLFGLDGNKNGVGAINLDYLEKILSALSAHDHSNDLGKDNLLVLKRYQNFLKKFGGPRVHDYYDIDFITTKLFDLNADPENIEDVYFRLQIISRRYQVPHSINLNGIFSLLPNLVWTVQGPMFLEDFLHFRDQSLWGHYPPITVTHVDKFPYLVNYHIPSGVRIASGSQVRLGAYLGEGTTVMPAGYVNFNAGTRGAAMVEGRVSAGVVVGEHSDVGGGASIMGTLSGGNKHVIEIGAKCLLGANAGTGISLGFGCTLAAGTYVTAASKVFLYDGKMKPINLEGNQVDEGENMVKAIELSGRDQLLFYLDSARGCLICRPNPKTIDLNPQLHGNVVN